MLVALTVSAGALLLLATVLFLAQGRMIYPARPYAPQVLAAFPAGLVPLRDAAGSLPAFYRPPAEGGAPQRLWMLFGGNGDQALSWDQFARTHAMPGVGFLMVEYPGYGACAGSPSPDAILRSSELAMTLLAAHLGLPEATLLGRTCGLGHSLGAAALTQYAARHRLQRLVLISPFTSMVAMAQRAYGWPLCQLLTHRFDNAARLAEIAAAGLPPTVILHGADDGFIPPAMGRELAAPYPAIVLQLIPAAGHNDVLDLGQEWIRSAMHQ